MANSDPGALAEQSNHQYDWQNPNHKSFDFGRVFGRSFTGIFANFKPLLIACLITLALTLILSIFTSDQLRATMGDGSPEDVLAATTTPSYWGWSLLGSIPAIFFALWLQLIVVNSAYAEFTQTPQQNAPLKYAIRFVLPMFVIAVIYTIVCTLGWVFLFIGFIFVWPGWALAGPILVHEKKGIFGSIGEAWTLSKGSKRWIFLLLLILSIISMVFYSVAMGIGLVSTGINAFGGDTAATLNMSIGQQVIYGAVFGLANYFCYALFASGITAAYVEIKTVKGGLASVGDVFA